ncbi:Protein of unknown function (DUF2619) [Halobacteroides halobius DSM 5150]|uniref:DUF2619 domain-containing protein n=1 Tax=Halobacteroides halobius (strain ATCC 35273 / DSM 5150 / MD-1) TaxID=748449 RepID=L0K849_HALHC|nr:YqhV family protein [Halobacteroides halobius]AGB41452.1 Protein of unknown function (DUF2619) [Halobacteroides halobius DSM 5150]
MFGIKDKIVLSMSAIRLISGMIELLAACLIFKFNSRIVAFEINSFLALVGPLVMVLATSVGLIGLADELSLLQMGVIVLGVILIFVGIKL